MADARRPERRSADVTVKSDQRSVDPTRGRVLEGPMLAGFEKERERVENMMNRKGGAPSRVAQTVGN
jgi:hypothetical protein